MALTPEEELELNMLESQEAPSAPVVQASQGLSPEEELEMAALNQAELNDVSVLESGIRGAASGVTLGFSDELVGLAGAGIRKIRGDQGDFNEIYEQERNIEREKNRLAEEANPIVGGLGGVVGGIGGVVLAGLPAAGFRAAAVLGGLSGVGFSNATGTELAKDAAIGVALGLGGEAVFKGVGRGIQKLVGKSSPSTNAVLQTIGETKHPQNVSFETNVYKQALKGGFKDMDAFFSSAEAKQTAATWAKDAHKIPKDILRKNLNNANAKLKAVISSPENQGKRVVISDIMDEFLGGESGINKFRSQGSQSQAVKVITKEIVEPLQSGKLRLNGRLVDPTNLEFDQAIEFKRLVSELTFQNADPMLDTAEQLAFRKAPAVSQRLKAFAGDIIERTNQADGTGLLKEVNGELSSLIEVEGLAPRNLKELRALTNDFGDSKQFFRGQEFLLGLDRIDPALKEAVRQEVVPSLTLVDAVDTARQWNVGVSTLFQAKAGASAIGPAGALVALGKGGSLLATQAVGKAAKAAFKIPRSIAGIMGNANMVVQKVSDFSPVLAIQINDMIHDRDVEGLRTLVETSLADPNVSAQFEQGMGFEGKVTSPEEAQQVRLQIMTSGLPLSQKIQAVNELESTQVIPNLQPPVQQDIPSPIVLKRKQSERSMNLVRKVEKEEGE